jgi:serine/threonine-protein kinase
VSKGKVFGIAVLAALLVSFLMCVAYNLWLDKCFDGFFAKFRQVEILDVRGIPIKQATNILGEQGLAVEVSSKVEDEEIPAGAVVAQKPAQGVRVTKGSIVKLTLSKGQPLVPVPEVSGMESSEARALIEQLGLAIGKVEMEASSVVDKGKVIASEPPAGQEIVKGTPIVLRISSGPKLVTVPRVTYKTLDEASRILQRAGLKLGNISKVCDIEQRFGIILRQSPGAGKKVRKESAVSVTINAEAEE